MQRHPSDLPLHVDHIDRVVQSLGTTEGCSRCQAASLGNNEQCPKCQMVGRTKIKDQQVSDDDSQATHSPCSCMQFMAAMELMGAPFTAGPSFLSDNAGTSMLLQDLDGELQHSPPAGSKPSLNQVGGLF